VSWSCGSLNQLLGDSKRAGYAQTDTGEERGAERNKPPPAGARRRGRARPGDRRWPRRVERASAISASRARHGLAGPRQVARSGDLYGGRAGTSGNPASCDEQAALAKKGQFRDFGVRDLADRVGVRCRVVLTTTKSRPSEGVDRVVCRRDSRSPRPDRTRPRGTV